MYQDDFYNFEDGKDLRMQHGKKNESKVFCPICGKPPTDKTICPNCKTENICAYHICEFYSDVENSAKGCPKCAPSCAVCGAKTTLVRFNKRTVCPNCMNMLHNAEEIKMKENIVKLDKFKKFFATFLALVGILGGLFFGSKVGIQESVYSIIKTQISPIFVMVIMSVLGLVASTIIMAIINFIFRTE